MLSSKRQPRQSRSDNSRDGKNGEDSETEVLRHQLGETQARLRRMELEMRRWRSAFEENETADAIATTRKCVTRSETPRNFKAVLKLVTSTSHTSPPASPSGNSSSRPPRESCIPSRTPTTYDASWTRRPKMSLPKTRNRIVHSRSASRAKQQSKYRSILLHKAVGVSAGNRLSIATRHRRKESAGKPIAPPFPIPKRTTSREVGNYFSGSTPARFESCRMARLLQVQPTCQSRAEFGLQSSSAHREVAAASQKKTQLLNNPFETPERQTGIVKIETISMKEIRIDIPARNTAQSSIENNKVAAYTETKGHFQDSYQHPALPAVDTVIRKGPDKSGVEVSSIFSEQRPTTTSAVSTRPILDRERQKSEVDITVSMAATVAGDWMWKYVGKKRPMKTSDGSQIQGHMVSSLKKSQSLSSTKSHEGGLRHKRWVWLSPSDRVIMWSKQPKFQFASYGGDHRQYVIESVLDIPDPHPNHDQSDIFNRSIVINTASRTIILTATSRESHYTWLAALTSLIPRPPSPNPFASSHLRPLTISTVGSASTRPRTALSADFRQRRDYSVLVTPWEKEDYRQLQPPARGSSKRPWGTEKRSPFLSRDRPKTSAGKGSAKLSDVGKTSLDVPGSLSKAKIFTMKPLLTRFTRRGRGKA